MLKRIAKYKIPIATTNATTCFLFETFNENVNKKKHTLEPIKSIPKEKNSYVLIKLNFHDIPIELEEWEEG